MSGNRKVYTALVAVTTVNEVYVHIHAESLEQAKLAFDDLMECGDEYLYETMLEQCVRNDTNTECRIEGEVIRSPYTTNQPDVVTDIQDHVDQWIEDNKEDE
jgi:hypothetical protein